MKTQYILQGLRDDERRWFRRRLDQIRARAEALLTHVQGPEANLQVWVRRSDKGLGAHAVLTSPLGPLLATARGTDHADMIDKLGRALLDQVRDRRAQWSSQLRQSTHRAHRELIAASPLLGELRADNRRVEFEQLFLTLAEPLRRYAARELELSTLGSPSGPHTVTVDDLMEDLVSEAWERWREIPEDALQRWALRWLNARVDTQGVGATRLDVDQQLQGSSSEQEDWIHGNAPFWPEGENLTLADIIAGGTPTDLGALHDLADNERRALLLSKVEGLPDDQVAAVLDVSEEAAAALIQQALDELSRLES